MVESEERSYERGEKWWGSAGSGASSLTVQLSLLDGAEGKLEVIIAKDKIRALPPNLPGTLVVGSSGMHTERVPPQWHPLVRSGVAASRLPFLILERWAMSQPWWHAKKPQRSCHTVS
jgi:hypothetical protein